MSHRPAYRLTCLSLASLVVLSACGRPLNAPEPEKLTGDGGFLGARFSPDGRRIVCTQAGLDALHLVVPDGQTRLLVRGPLVGQRFAWFPDGTALAVRKGEGRLKGIFMVDMAGEVTPLDRLERHLTPPQVWREAVYVAGFDERPPEPAARLPDPIESNATEGDAEGDRERADAGVPDTGSRSSAHSEGTESERGERAEGEPRKARPTGPGNDPTDLAPDDGPSQTPAPPDLSFPRDNEGRIELWVDGGWRDLTPSAEPGIHFTEPGVSPDGRLLAVSGTDGSVRVLTREGDEVLELVGNDPAWCPDSQHLVYAVTEDGLHEIAASELFVVAVDGSRARIALTDTPDRIEQRPDVAPDGSAVIFDAGGAIWRLPLAGGCRARLAAAEG